MKILFQKTAVVVLGLIMTPLAFANQYTCPNLEDPKHPPISPPWQEWEGNPDGAHIFQRAIIEDNIPITKYNHVYCVYADLTSIMAYANPRFHPINTSDWYKRYPLDNTWTCIGKREVCTFEN